MLIFTFVLEDGAQPQHNSPKIDEGLIKRIGKGDMGAFDELYHLTERTLYAYVLSLTKDHDTSLDIMQETYVKLISAAHLYKPMGKPLAWIFTIAKNLFYSKIRKSNREVNIDSVDISDDKKFSYITEMDDKIVLEGVLNLLSEEEREIVMLYAVSGLKHREIAENLNLKLSTTLSKYNRALKVKKLSRRKGVKGMKEERILISIKKSIESAPIDILDNIKKQQIPKMLKHDEITRQSKSITKTIMPIMSLVAALIMVFGLWQFQYRMPDSHVYLDVNPSIEIVTNKKDQVINIIPYNSDARELVDDIDYMGRDVVIVTEEVVRELVDLGYIKSSEDYILLSVYNKDLEKLQSQKLRLNSSIHTYMEKEEFVPIVLMQNLEKTSTIESYAKDYGISLSKMTFIRNMIILNPELEVEDLVDLSLKDLIALSQSMELDLESIIESDDFERIPDYKPIEVDDDDDHDDFDDFDDEDDYDDDEEISERPTRRLISTEEARRIALSLTNGGTITSMELDDDEYEIEVIKDGKEYDIEIDAYSGKVLDFDVDQIDDDDDDDDD